MVQFTRLRIHGFKSFVEKTELNIGAGQNGIVGPNGCGKSNLVEALRWVMGENSAKRMRGDGMEDVIFNGTDKRSPRNIAEVSLLLDNSERTAPPAYNQSDEIEISRRIERDKGSQYRINGRPVRARDVQMFFADSVSGAHSPALVSQGRITEIIKAKPADRRLVLEDSAGISGLFARRHEAELKLKAADQNLLRVEDIIGSLQSRLNGLKRQAQQAQRYKEISNEILALEKEIAALSYRHAQGLVHRAKRSFDEAEGKVSEQLVVVSQLTQTQTTQAQDLPALRKSEAEAAAALQSKNIALQHLEDDAARYSQALDDLKTQEAQIKTDQSREEDSLVEVKELLERLELDKQDTQSVIEQTKKSLTEMEVKRAQEKEALDVLEQNYTAQVRSVAEHEAKAKAFAGTIASFERQIAQLGDRADRYVQQITDLQAAKPEGPSSEEYEQKISAIRSQIDELEQQQESLQENILDKKNAMPALREQEQAAAQNAQKILSEIEVLESFFATEDDEDAQNIRALVTPQKGYESALSRALGDGMMSSLDARQDSFWLDLGIDLKDAALPAGCVSLLDYVEAPAALSPALSFVGVAPQGSDLLALARDLLPGQSLVSQDGDFYRWDGYVVTAAAKDTNAEHLNRKTRLAELRDKKAYVQNILQKAQDEIAVQRENLAELDSDLNSKRQAQRELQSQEQALLKEQSRGAEARARYEQKLEGLKENLQSAENDKISVQEQLTAAQREYEEAQEQVESSDILTQEDLKDLERALAESRQGYNEILREYDRLSQKQQSKNARLRALGDERVSANNRMIRSSEYLKQLEQRAGDVSVKLAELLDNPIDHEKSKNKLLEQISQYEEARNKAAEELSACETGVFETGKALKEAETLLGDYREARAVAQSMTQQAQDKLTEAKGYIFSQYNQNAEEFIIGYNIDQDLDSQSLPAQIKDKQNETLKAQASRERMGAVNLRADEELQEVESEFKTLSAEHEDLSQAVSTLRNSIATINKEARERLVEAFDTVNAHFKILFSKLFVGGAARLELVDSDDPLEAGLEIFAQPPGKALQSLSLLSGGEQTMASIALIFAMFLTNPSPICVLDEIDAPLDDANVDKVCNLIDDIAARGETRFLIVTHHRLTMARMDWLYGVTMQERGVSQLISVDLQQSFDFVDAA